ncbi:MAG: hypothetical protein LBT34_00470 [Clostridiales Family XIII bacterium]|jgi:hypothetical protein|nr:hypothetical protein [Clostridiales Family XIII bacterium]
MPERPVVGRVLSREREESAKEYAGHSRMKVGVFGLSSGAGVTFLALNLARKIANERVLTPAVVELSEGNEGIYGWNYDVIGMDRRFSLREYFSFYGSVAKGESIRNKANMDEGVNYALRLPAEPQISLDQAQLSRLVNNVAGEVILCDFSARLSFGETDEVARNLGMKRLLSDMDVILAVVDPMPSKLMGGYKRLELLKTFACAGKNIVYVINKDNRGVNDRELTGFLKAKRLLRLPLASVAEQYEAEYNCRVSGCLPDTRKMLDAKLARIVESIDLF